jgi:hypothetical protein
MHQSLIISFIFAMSVQSKSFSAPQLPLQDDLESDTPFHPSFDKFVESLLESWHIPGLAIAVVHENKTWTKVGT